jgi:hypothetical protein
VTYSCHCTSTANKKCKKKNVIVNREYFGLVLVYVLKTVVLLYDSFHCSVFADMKSILHYSVFMKTTVVFTVVILWTCT